jgi:hypothetical protein
MIAKAHRGDKLNIVRAPRYAEQQWTEVQWVIKGRPSPAGFVRTQNLGNWSGATPSMDAQLGQMFSPPVLDVAATQAPPVAEAPPPPGPKRETPKPAAAPVNAGEEIHKAENLWMQGEYDKAAAVLNAVLKVQPQSSAASVLLIKVRKAKEAEERP